MTSVLVHFDRDGTLIVDPGNFPGSADCPASQIQLMPGVVEGLRLLREKAAHAKLVIATNQSGVARRKISAQDIELVNARVQELTGNAFDGVYYCEHVPKSYVDDVRKRKGDVPLDFSFVKDCPDYKPGTGMLEKAAKDLHGKKIAECRHYVVGDRGTDVLTALNAGGIGVFVPSDEKTRSNVGEAEVLAKKYPGRVLIADNFLHAAELIIQKESA
jgi:histidinol-phosphate phosphatase family protein